MNVRPQNASQYAHRCLLPPTGQRVWAANGAGAVEALDLRAGRMGGSLKGAGGSVRSLALHPGGEPLIASAGLDRFVRVHNTSTRANLGRAYTKQQLTAVAWLPPLPAGPSGATEAAGELQGSRMTSAGEAAAQGRPTGTGSGGDHAAGSTSTGSGHSNSSSDSSDSGGNASQRRHLGNKRTGGGTAGKRKAPARGSKKKPRR